MLVCKGLLILMCVLKTCHFARMAFSANISLVCSLMLFQHHIEFDLAVLRHLVQPSVWNDFNLYPQYIPTVSQVHFAHPIFLSHRLLLSPPFVYIVPPPGSALRSTVTSHKWCIIHSTQQCLRNRLDLCVTVSTDPQYLSPGTLINSNASHTVLGYFVNVKSSFFTLLLVKSLCAALYS